MRVASGFAILSMCATLSSLAQPPHVGTWEIDSAKSDGGEQVWSFVDLGSGLWEFRSGGRRIFHFRMDEDECATCEASLYTWELIGPETYLTSFLGPWARDVVKIAPDGRSLSFIQRRPGATGELEDHIGTFQRFSGGPGLAGTWRSEFERSMSAPLVEFSPGVGEWFVFKWTSRNVLSPEVICVLLLDGADHPCFNAWARGLTIAMKVIDARTLRAVLKVNGDMDAELVYTVSSNGRSMIRAQRSVTGDSMETVYNRRIPTADR
jgi:hypothetical protein